MTWQCSGCLAFVAVGDLAPTANGYECAACRAKGSDDEQAEG